MGVKERRTREKESLRQEILDAARELFVQEGYESVTMRRIAEKIEYSPTTIYLYFQDKTDLLHSICEEMFLRLIARLTAIQEQTSDPLDALKAGLREYVNFGLENPQHYRVTFMAPHNMHDFEHFEDPSAAGHQAFEFLCTAVGRCVQAGKLPQLDVFEASQVLWAGVHGLTSLFIAKSGFPFVERNKLIRLTVDTLVGGLGV